MQHEQTGFHADENLSPDAAAPRAPDGEILSAQRRERQRKSNSSASGQSVMKRDGSTPGDPGTNAERRRATSTRRRCEQSHERQCIRSAVPLA